jgi:hypothetical protein
VLLLIDTRDRRPPPPRPEPWRPNLRPLLPLALAVVLLVVAGLVPPLPSYLLILGAIALISRTISKLLPPLDGLRDYRQ